MRLKKWGRKTKADGSLVITSLRLPLNHSKLTLEIHLSQVKQQHKHTPSVIRIDHSSTGMNRMFGSQSTSRSHSTISSSGDGDGELGVDEGFTVSWDGFAFGAVLRRGDGMSNGRQFRRER